MKIKPKAAWFAVFAAVLIVATSLTSTASANAATVPVTDPTQRAEITAGARHYLHLDDEQIKTVLADKTIAAQIPVRTITSSSPLPSQVAPDGCNGITSHARNVGVFGNTIWDFSLYKYWCWDGYRVTFLPDSAVGIYISSKARTLWQYKGAVKGTIDLAPVPGGIRGQQSWAQGHLDFCVFKVGCISSADPVALVTGWFDGHYDTNAWLNL